MATQRKPTWDKRFTDVDYPHDTKGPTWTENTCAIDSLLWTAKGLGIGQIRCDQGFEARNSPFQEQVFAVLRRNWRTAGAAEVNEVRNRLVALWDSNADIKKMQPVLRLWEDAFVGCPSLSWTIINTAECGCTITPNAEQHLNVLDTAPRVKGLDPHEVAPTRDLSGKLHLQFASRWTGRLCQKGCEGDEANQRRQIKVVNCLPLYFTLEKASWAELRRAGANIEFLYCLPSDVDEPEVDTRYRTRAIIMYRGSHFTSALVDWKNDHIQACVYYDGRTDNGHPKVHYPASTMGAYDWLEKRGGEISLLILEVEH